MARTPDEARRIHNVEQGQAGAADIAILAGSLVRELEYNGLTRAEAITMATSMCVAMLMKPPPTEKK